ncbi:MAG: hypothetical protein U0Y10_26040 [Spirosomataceae bacterium]
MKKTLWIGLIFLSACKSTEEGITPTSPPPATTTATCRVTNMAISPTENYELTYADGKVSRIVKNIGQEKTTLDIGYGNYNGAFFPVESLQLTTASKGVVSYVCNCTNIGCSFFDGTNDHLFKAKVVNGKFLHTDLYRTEEHLIYKYDMDGNYIGYDVEALDSKRNSIGVIRSKRYTLSKTKSAQSTVQYFGGLIVDLISFEPWLDFEPTNVQLIEFDDKGNQKSKQEYKAVINETNAKGYASKITWTTSDGKTVIDTRSFKDCN